MRKMLNLRYRLLPYIYSEAWQVTKNGSTMMNPMVMDFNGGTAAVKSQYQYTFGKSVLTAPVTEPDVTQWDVYLSKSTEWYDFWKGERFYGGQTIKTDAPLDKIPLFVKARSIIPMGKIIQYASEKSADTIEIRVYKGADAKFDLYEDEGDNYNYEKGNHSIILFKWDEKRQTLTIGDKQGNYQGALKKRIFNIVLATKNKGFGTNTNSTGKKILYVGSQVNRKLQ
jgi:alpha-D-xyloside xylohydrolase